MHSGRFETGMKAEGSERSGQAVGWGWGVIHTPAAAGRTEADKAR